MTALLGHIALLMSGGAGATCPDYSTVTLYLTSTPYTAPDGDDAELQLLDCPYTAPTVS